MALIFHENRYWNSYVLLTGVNWILPLHSTFFMWCGTWKQVRTGELKKKIIKWQFHENRYWNSYILLTGVNWILPLLSTFFMWCGAWKQVRTGELKKNYEMIVSFRKIGVVKFALCFRGRKWISFRTVRVYCLLWAKFDLHLVLWSICEFRENRRREGRVAVGKAVFTRVHKTSWYGENTEALCKVWLLFHALQHL